MLLITPLYLFDAIYKIARNFESGFFRRILMKQFFNQALISIACISFLIGCNTGIKADTDLYEASNLKKMQESPFQSETAGACFAADTLVMMADGSSKKIIAVKVGDKVKSFDIQAGKAMDTEVINTKSGFAGYYYVINGGLKVTPPHPFCTPDDKWVKIKDLREGQTVRVSNSIRKISSIEHKLESQRIYNIYVKDNHNFFVSGDGKDFFLVKEWR